MSWTYRASCATVFLVSRVSSVMAIGMRVMDEENDDDHDDDEDHDEDDDDDDVKGWGSCWLRLTYACMFAGKRRVNFQSALKIVSPMLCRCGGCIGLAL